ncbi:MAG: GGDEF domain-containing protein [Geminicoccaceae bacterium]|nr:GGDEF domain-containing protein [Geminicoccaceae bacterium]
MTEPPADPFAVVQRPVVRALLLRSATHDRETGCLDELYFTQRAAEEIARRQRYGGRLSLLVIAPDPPAEGEASGSEAVVRLAARVRGRLRSTDLVARWPTGELLVLMPGTGLSGATRLARRILASGPAPGESGPALPVLASIGVATWLGVAETLGTLIDRARAGLAEARARGGGCVGVS